MSSEEQLLENAGKRQQQPVTPSRLVRELADLGLRPGMTVVVHTSLSKIGWVPGGAQGVIAALLDLLTATGTLVMPAHSGNLSDPANWIAPPVPKTWWDDIRNDTPAYDPALTPTRNMGAVAESFRKYPGVQRSAHPHVSFTALGPNAARVLADHRAGCMFGERSPLARLYELDAHVLLLGVVHANNTSIHLAEYRAEFPGKRYHTEGAPMMVDGSRQWVSFEDLQTSDDDFAALGEDFARETGLEGRGSVGWGEARLMRVRAIVDYAVAWLSSHR
ncbi:MAG: AAC(3) family N-acetyltransferase [Gammaproteobacteria bacterium]|nr:AAC(3) family N-acetyltransferase [Gammaproteobacteria bacterium]